MATVQVPFIVRPNQASTPFGHRFSSNVKHPSPPPPSTFSQPYPQQQQQQQQNQFAPSPGRWGAATAVKRRHADEEDEYDEQEEQEEGRPRRIAGGKRAKRTVDGPKGQEQIEGHRTPGGTEIKPEDEIDVGVLLASVPQASLLPLLTELVKDTPSLKSKILTLMPRPTTSSVLTTLSAAAQKVHSAYPYSSSTPVFGGLGFGQPFQPTAPPSFGFGVAFGSAVSHSAPPAVARDSFARARLRVPVNDFVTTVLSYLPYFTLTLGSQSSNSSQKSQPHPSETFTYLHAATSHALQLLPLFGAPTPLPDNFIELLNRLLNELATWSHTVDQNVNAQGGMYGSDMVRAWAKGLDELAMLGGQQWPQWQRLRDEWSQRCGWLIGRLPGYAPISKEEDVEL